MNQSTAQSTLWDLKKGQSCMLTSFDEQLDPRYRDRVLELGFSPNSKVSCLKNSTFGSPKVYQVNNSVFSLEDTIATRILVEILDTKQNTL